MDSFILSQIIVACAFATGILSFQFRDKDHVSIAWFITTMLIGTHFFLLDSPEAGALTILNSFRFLVSIFTDKIVVMFVFMFLSFVGFYWTYQSPISLFILLPVQLGIYTSFRSKDQEFRIIMMVIGVLWIIYDTIIGSPVAVIMETCFIISNCLAYYRLYIKQKPK